MEWKNIKDTGDLYSTQMDFQNGRITYSPIYGHRDDAVDQFSFLKDGSVFIIPKDGQDADRDQLELSSSGDRLKDDQPCFLNGFINMEAIERLYQFLRFQPDYYASIYYYRGGTVLNTFPQSSSVDVKPTYSTDMGENLINLLKLEFGYFHITGKRVSDEVGSVVDLLKKFNDYTYCDSSDEKKLSITSLINKQDCYVADVVIWNRIKTFEDLIEVNSSFVEGKIYKSPYHGGPVTNDMDVSNLSKINRLGFITIDGQPYSPISISELNGGRGYIEQIQIPYLVGILLEKHFIKFVDFMKTQPHFYYIATKFTQSSDPLILRTNYDQSDDESDPSGDKPKLRVLMNTLPKPDRWSDDWILRNDKFRIAKEIDQLQDQPWETVGQTVLYEYDTDRVIQDLSLEFGGGRTAIKPIIDRDCVQLFIVSDFEHHESIIDMMYTFMKSL